MNQLVSSEPSIRLIEEYLLPALNHLKSNLSGCAVEQHRIVISIEGRLVDFFSKFTEDEDEDWTGCPALERFMMLRKTLLDACRDLTTELFQPLGAHRQIAMQLLSVPSEIIGLFSCHAPPGLPPTDLLEDIPMMDCFCDTLRQLLLGFSGMVYQVWFRA